MHSFQNKTGARWGGQEQGKAYGIVCCLLQGYRWESQQHRRSRFRLPCEYLRTKYFPLSSNCRYINTNSLDIHTADYYSQLASPVQNVHKFYKSLYSFPASTGPQLSDLVQKLVFLFFFLLEYDEVTQRSHWLCHHCALIRRGGPQRSADAVEEGTRRNVWNINTCHTASSCFPLPPGGETLLQTQRSDTRWCTCKHT